MDNASANTTFIKELGVLMKQKNIPFSTEDQHFRCFSHIMNLAVQDTLKLINIDIPTMALLQDTQESDDENDDYDFDYDDDNVNEQLDTNGIKNFLNVIIKVRKLCKKIKYSEPLKKKLALMCTATGVDFIKVTLDVRTRWDSTFDMINIILKLNIPLKSLWDTCPEVHEYKIREAEWSILEKIFNFLKYFKQVSKLLGGEKYITLPSVVVVFNKLIDKIESTIFELDTKTDRTREDEILLLAFQAGRDKLLKHYKKCNWVYCVSLILDPRHKLEGFDLTSWGQELKEPSIKKFEDMFQNMYCINSKNDECVNEKKKKQ